MGVSKLIPKICEGFPKFTETISIIFDMDLKYTSKARH